MTIDQIAARAGISTGTVRREIKLGNLRVEKLGPGEYRPYAGSIYRWLLWRAQAHGGSGKRPRTVQERNWLAELVLMVAQ
jgi:hypothetical protein